jgi:pimeloyl-ACP methyl ester carboxylesterase
MTMRHPENGRAASLYEGLAPELVAELRGFRTRFPYEHAQVGGRQWPYLDTASGESVVLLLSGAAGVALMSWRSIEHLARRNRVIAPDYPSVDTMAELVDGIALILDRQRVGRAHVVGGSYGGFVAQVFVRRHPDRTASLVLSHTLVPDRAGVARVATVTRWMRWVPERALRALFRLRLGRLFPEAGPPELALSKALFTEVVNYRLTKAEILSLMRRVVDLGTNYRFTPGDLEAWPGRILLLMGSDDPATPEPARQALIALYPRAATCVFSGAGHLTAILKQEEYFSAMDQFLAGPLQAGGQRT